MSRKLSARVIKQARIGQGTVVNDNADLYKCRIGKNCKIGAFVYIEEGVEIGDNVKIRPFTMIPNGVKIEDDVFIGPGVIFNNDKFPRVRGRWRLLKTFVKKGSSIGAGCLISPGVTIGAYSLIGFGSVVTKDIEDYAIAFGFPARSVGKVTDTAFKLKVKNFLTEGDPSEYVGESSDWPWP